jgi:adenine-specific DNA-methyltransferase
VKKEKQNANFTISNRRYIGSKAKLVNWIFSIISAECNGKSFADIFAGTGVISNEALKHFDKVIINDFLYSNFVIYNAFFKNESYNLEKLNDIVQCFNSNVYENAPSNYFSKNFGDKYFSISVAKKIGIIRESIEELWLSKRINEKEYYILIASLIYSIDKIANTVGHYESFRKDAKPIKHFHVNLIKPIPNLNVSILREDANELAKKLVADIVYIDPPYNSRQYSRFYHLLETLVKWDYPKLSGVAMKPKPENMSDYSRSFANSKFRELIYALNCKYIVVSYNNTYNSKSSSSTNKMKLDDIKKVLARKGELKVFDIKYKHFNAGKTDFNNHKEYLFIVKVKNDKE